MGYRFKGFSRTATKMLNQALRIAGEYGHGCMGTHHILLAILQTETTPAAVVLRSHQIGVVALQGHLRQMPGGRSYRISAKDLMPEASKALEFARMGARCSHTKEAQCEHILCAILEDSQCTASRWLVQQGTDLSELARECRQMTGQLVVPPLQRMSTTSTRATRTGEKYGRDLTRMAAQGVLDPVFCREQELERVIQILCRRQKNNPCLVGEPGVGKTAIAEALAQRIATGQIPASLQGKRLLSLDLASLVAGTKYRGDFEERFKGFMEEISREKNTILFVDEIHILVGAGAAEGSIDAANILKPMLARGDLQLMGATTREEYRRCIQKDPALERRLSQVWVEEPTKVQAMDILKGLAIRYEAFHNIEIPAETRVAAVELSARYLPERFLPDKAVDVLDEAAAWAVSHPIGEGKAVLMPQHIAQVIGRMTGIPVEKISEENRCQLEQLESRLTQKVVGQSRAVQVVAGAIRRASIGLRDENRPMGAMLFLGPTGVGKTHLAKCIAKEWFHSEKALIRLDMSEYMESHTSSRLIGAPPGYVGHGEGGFLTEAIRKRPYAVVVFDEMEKAHPDVQNLLLQILEEGCLTDSMGRKADFRHALILITSNLGARYLDEQTSCVGFQVGEQTRFERQKQLVVQEARRYFKPELLGRMDEMVVFSPLGKEHLAQIAEQLLVELEQRATKLGYLLCHTKQLVEHLADGSSKQYGARGLRTEITRKVEQALADGISSGVVSARERIIADVEEGGVCLHRLEESSATELQPAAV